MDARRATAEALLSSIVSAHGRQLTRFFLSRVPEPSEAQDLVQEVYLRVLKLERPELICSPRVCLYRVAANIAQEYWLKRTTLPSHVELEERPDEGQPAPDEAAETTQRMGQLETVLGELSPKVRAALVWAHRDGHTYEEIGARLSVPKNRVKKYLTKAMAHCRAGMTLETATT